MRMKRREGAKHDRRSGYQAQSFTIHAAVRGGDFDRVWLSEPAAADRTRKIHPLVAATFSARRSGNRVGDVSLFTLKERCFRG
jgi:hypothetical protein